MRVSGRCRGDAAHAEGMPRDAVHAMLATTHHTWREMMCCACLIAWMGKQFPLWRSAENLSMWESCHCGMWTEERGVNLGADVVRGWTRYLGRLVGLMMVQMYIRGGWDVERGHSLTLHHGCQSVSQSINDQNSNQQLPHYTSINTSKPSTWCSQSTKPLPYAHPSFPLLSLHTDQKHRSPPSPHGSTSKAASARPSTSSTKPVPPAQSSSPSPKSGSQATPTGSGR